MPGERGLFAAVYCLCIIGAVLLWHGLALAHEVEAAIAPAGVVSRALFSRSQGCLTDGAA
jgi:hypothetical protein